MKTITGIDFLGRVLIGALMQYGDTTMHLTL